MTFLRNRRSDERRHLRAILTVFVRILLSSSSYCSAPPLLSSSAPPPLLLLPGPPPPLLSSSSAPTPLLLSLCSSPSAAPLLSSPPLLLLPGPAAGPAYPGPPTRWRRLPVARIRARIRARIGVIRCDDRAQRPGAKGGCFATRKEHEPCFYYVPKILKKAFFS